ncbi:PPE domain-containing protein [Mycobacterium sp. M1]|uniref:PPE domain-containing protein n=1 Tax=Mycolicibacter acidiphilus TaxID=2835306 RepID=A0ABS5RG01_9MYCO|nr:PPE domain-containing protein [Mycolicibacter acidiphilus]MBS9533216.1 PPE domain-containing protein [Mycolicibacter acidiphilus]
MNFAVLPPEVNSALMYTGAGSGSIRAAATAWQAMATELASASQAYRAVITSLTGEFWLGPASVAMAAAATPYVTWMHATATQAGHAASQAEAAAAAYETAFAMTVPPAVVAANRTRLATLVATNLLGQNTAAIAATEAHYGEMWAQDSTAMYGYAANAQAATQLPSFTAPKQTAGSAADSGGYDGAGELGLELDVLVTAIEVESFAPFEGGGAGLEFGSLAIEAASLGPFSGEGFGALGGLGMIGSITPVPGGAGGLGASLAGAKPGIAGAARTGAVFASAGRAVPLGALSVPQAWAAAAPAALRQVTLVAAQSSAAAASAVTSAAEIPFTQLALAGAAGRALAGSAGRREQAAAPAPLCAESPDEPEEPPTRPVQPVVAELRALVELRDTGILTEDTFNQRKQRLLGG